MVESSEAASGSAASEPGRGQAPPITVPMHGLTRYLRARVAVTGGVMRWNVPRTLLGVIPLGVQEITVPIGEVRSIRIGKVARPLRLMFGTACVAVPWFFVPWWAAAPIAVVGLWVILVSLGPHLEVVTRSGARHRAGVCFGHQMDAELYIAAVNDLVQQAQDGR